MPDFSALSSALTNSKISYSQNESLAAHSSFKIGGLATFFICPANAQQLKAAIVFCKEFNVKSFILGRGTNVLFSDAGFSGAIIYIGESFNQIIAEGDKIKAYSGASLSDVCKSAHNASLTGLEFAYGIPGCVGGAIFMNAGAYDGEIKDVVESVEYLDENGNLSSFSNSDSQFAYRSSVFQKKNGCIISAVFKLKSGNTEAIGSKMNDFAQRRADKQPLDMPSAGSAFKRPKGAYAGELIDKCGLRGKRVGNACISEKHCGFIVNCGGATCSDVLALADEVCRVVYEQTGYNLEKEIRVIE